MNTYRVCDFATNDTTYECQVSGTAALVSASGTGWGFYSDYAARVNPTGSGTGYFEIKLADLNGNGKQQAAAGLNAIHAGWWFAAPTCPATQEQVAVFHAGSGSVYSIRINSSGLLSVYEGTTQLAADVVYVLGGGGSNWLWFDCDSGGNFELYVNGFLILSGTGSGGPTFDVLRLGKVSNLNSDSVDYYFGHVLIADASYPSPRICEHLTPTGEGTHTDWTIGAGGSKTAAVSLPHDGDTSYITSDPNYGNQSFTLSDMLESPDELDCLAVYALVAKDGASDAEPFVFARCLDTTQPQGNSVAVSGYTFLEVGFPVGDGSAPWTTAGANGAEAAVGWAAGDHAKCTTIGAYAVYGNASIPVDGGGYGTAPVPVVLNICGWESGSLIEALATGGDGTVEIRSDNTRGAHSEFALRISATTTQTAWASIGEMHRDGSTANGKQSEYTDGSGAKTGYHRWYMEVSAHPSAEEQCGRFLGCDVQFCIGSDGKLRVYADGSEIFESAAALTAATVYRIEWKHVSGAWGIRIYDDDDASPTLIESDTGTDTWINETQVSSFVLGKYDDLNGASITIDFDDYAISANTWCGPGKCIRRDVWYLVTADNWTGDETDVSEAPADDDTTYLDSDTASWGDTIVFALPPFPTETSVLAAKAFAVIKRDGGTNGSVNLTQFVDGGTVESNTGLARSTSAYEAIGRLADVNPDTAAQWNGAELDDCRIGVVEHNATYNTRVTQLCQFVDYVGDDPGPPPPPPGGSLPIFVHHYRQQGIM